MGGLWGGAAQDAGTIKRSIVRKRAGIFGIETRAPGQYDPSPVTIGPTKDEALSLGATILERDPDQQE
jgi:hypothetical protein